jgi:ATP-dependent RNA helicase DDX6/DHH1
MKTCTSTDPTPSPQQTTDVTQTKNIKWNQMNLKETTVQGIIRKGLFNPSPVQEESIPIIQSGADIIARSKNGTGKTAAFLIPTIDKIDVKKKKIQAMILVPTRELALQTERVIQELGHFTDIKTMVSTGGTSVKDDILRLEETVHISRDITYLVKSFINN